MNNKEQVNMQSIIFIGKILVDAWRKSKCPESSESYCCAKCKYNELCAKIVALAKVVDK